MTNSVLPKIKKSAYRDKPYNCYSIDSECKILRVMSYPHWFN